jgi:TorA maturation chaperone TorD
MARTTDGQGTELEMAGVARLLSLGFLPPSREAVDEMMDLATALAAQLPPSPLRDDVAALRVALHGASARDEHSGEHHRLFAGTVACPPYESSYAPDPFQQARQMSDVAGFYRAFGAEPSGPAADRPDQVGCELEFLAYLVLTRVEAGRAGRPDDAAVCADAEDAFLRDHLGRWLGPFCRELEKVTVNEAYRALALLGQRFAVEELGRRGVTADPVLARRIRTVVEHDTLSCGADSATAGGVLDEVVGRRGRAREG